MKAEHRASKLESDSGHEEHLPGWVGVGKFLLLAVFTGMLYLLGTSMVRHNFFSGSLNYQMSNPRQERVSK